MRRAHQRKVQGFTLIELMVAMMLGALAVGTIYYVSAASARHFHEQQRVAQTQMAVRMAMEQLRRDIQRAGFLGTPNSLREPGRCMTPPQEIQAVEGFRDSDTAALPNAAENGVRADRLRLTGNYASGDSYLAVGFNAVGGAVILQKEWQAFRRSFGVFGTTFDPAAFQEVFRVGRVLHITTLQGKHFFPTITGVDPATATVSFTPNLGIGGSCVVGLADGATVAPLSRIEWLVTDLTGSTAANLAPLGGAAAAFTGDVPSQLVRREIVFANPGSLTDAFVPGTQRIVLEYVADFEVSYMVDSSPAPATTTPRNITPLAVLPNGAATNPGPHDARSIIVSLSARTAEQNPNFPWAARAPGAPLTRYRVNATMPGAARVRTLRQEVFLHNLANRNIQP